MRYLIYLRVSTKKQDVETQLHHCLKFIKQRDSSEFKYEVFQDKITSRKTLFHKKRDVNDNWVFTREFKREGAKKLFDTLQKGDVIVAVQVDRIARTAYEINQVVDILEKLDCEIMLVNQPGIKNKILLGLYAGMAEEEVVQLRLRVTQTLQKKKDKGERYSRHLPYGFAMHETKTVSIRVGDDIVQKRGILIPVHEEQQAIERMKELFDHGLSYKRISTMLTNESFLNRQDKPFDHATIYRILNRIGKKRPTDQLQEVC